MSAKTLQLSIWAWRLLWAQPLTAALNLLLLTLGLACMGFVLLVSTQLERSLTRDVQGIDLVVGAKGSPLQLILAGVFHLDAPSGNIALAQVQALQQHPQVAQLIPLSLGDSFRGYRIVGTEPSYVALYGARVAAGQLWQAPMQAVLGAQVAANTQLTVNGQFYGSHGLGEQGTAHGEHAYQVVGVLAPCDCVLDRLILSATESVWQVHENEQATDEQDRIALRAEREVTVALLRYTTPLAAVTLPRYVNSQTQLQAAAPALEIARLMRMLGAGAEVVRALAALLLASAALSVFIALWGAVRQREADWALLRLLGAPPKRLGALVLAQALWLSLLASGLAWLLAHGMSALLGWLLLSERSVLVSGTYFTIEELWLPVLAFGVALLAAAIPLRAAYRADVLMALNRG